MIELQILFEIQSNPNITAEQLAEKINKTPRTAENYLSKLKKKQLKEYFLLNDLSPTCATMITTLKNPCYTIKGI